MSTTPRTDAREARNGNVLCGVANLDLARILETELTVAQAAILQLQDATGNLGTELSAALSRSDELKAQIEKRHVCASGTCGTCQSCVIREMEKELAASKARINDMLHDAAIEDAADSSDEMIQSAQQAALHAQELLIREKARAERWKAMSTEFRKVMPQGYDFERRRISAHDALLKEDSK